MLRIMNVVTISTWSVKKEIKRTKNNYSARILKTVFCVIPY